ncbi:MAG: DUF2628 domain-containing protein [Candidatus Omnitrophica bacterium]|nr:DUF2628 domain-containing protein [Candidatus Omnitrophota bacterium]
MKQCSKCQKQYDDTWAMCLDCGERLDNVAGDGVTDRSLSPKKEMKKYFRDAFAKFDSGEIISWNWFAAIFQFLWYLFKGLWPKMFLYGIFFWALERAALYLELYSVSSYTWIFAFICFGLMANYDYYLHKVKNEKFWPAMPYRKVKAYFWSALVLVLAYNLFYTGFRSAQAMMSFVKQNKPGMIKSLDAGTVKFGKVPGEWIVYKDPPEGFSIKLSRPVGNGLNENMNYVAFPGTRVIGYIVDGNVPAEAVYKGIIAVIENKPRFGKGFDSPRDENVLRKIKIFAGIGEPPFYMDWMKKWFNSEQAEAEYLDISGREWGNIRNTMKMKFMGKDLVFYFDLYWTVKDGAVISVISESFAPFKDGIKAQVITFLGSFE